MWPYFVAFGIAALPAITSERASRSPRDVTFAVLCVLLVLFIGLRLQVGGDWYTYLRIFYYARAVDLQSAMQASDPAYGLLNWLVGRLGFEMWAVNLACAAMFVWGLRSLCRIQPNPRLALLVAVPYMCIVIAMGYTRQSVALGLVMGAIADYQRGKTVRFIFLLVAAAAFHKSAVIVIPLFILARRNTNVVSVGASILVFVVAYRIFLSSAVDTLMENYVGTGYSSGGAAVRVGMNVLAAVVLLVFRKNLGFEGRDARLWYVFAVTVLITVPILIISPSSTAVDRAALYLFPLQIAVLPRVAKLGNKGRHNHLPLFAIIGYSFAVLSVWLFTGNVTWTWLPYRTYLWVPSNFVPGYHRY